MNQLLLLSATLTACGVSSAQPTPKPSGDTKIAARTQAQLTVAEKDWERFWAPPPDAGMSTVQPMMPPPGPPPKEATDACAAKAQGAACAFTHDGHSLSGTCGKTPEGQAVCVPQGMMPPPPQQMERVLGGTLAGLSSTPLLVVVRPSVQDDQRVEVSADDFILEPDTSSSGGVDLSIDHGQGFEAAGYYRRVAANP